jgi:hypothetical protein
LILAVRKKIPTIGQFYQNDIDGSGTYVWPDKRVYTGTYKISFHNKPARRLEEKQDARKGCYHMAGRKEIYRGKNSYYRIHFPLRSMKMTRSMAREFSNGLMAESTLGPG